MHLRDLATDTGHSFPTPTTVRLGDILRDTDVASIPLRLDHVDSLRDKFQPHLVGMPIVSKREDGTLAVLNGSHRCEALRQLFDDDLELDVSLYEGLTRDQEVAIFERHHKAFLGESRAKDAAAADEPESHIWSADIDDTATACSKQFARLTHALRAAGDKVVFVTGHGPEDSRKELLDTLGIEYDSIVIVDPEEDGSGKAAVLKQIGSWFHFDNEVAFGPEIIKVCPVTFQYIPPPGDVKPKKAAKKAEKDLKRSLRDRFHGTGRSSPFREVRVSPYAGADEDGDWA